MTAKSTALATATEAVTTFKLYTDPVEYNAKFNLFRQNELARRHILHELFMSSIWHVATHGNINILQRLYDSLTTNDQQAMRMAIGRYQTEGEFVTDNRGNRKYQAKLDAEGNPVLSAVAFLKYERRGWTILPGAMKEGGSASKFIPFLKDKLLKPTDEYPAFYNINTVREQREFNISGAIAQLKRLVSRVAKEEGVPDALKVSFENAFKQVEHDADQVMTAIDTPKASKKELLRAENNAINDYVNLLRAITPESDDDDTDTVEQIKIDGRTTRKDTGVAAS